MWSGCMETTLHEIMRKVCTGYRAPCKRFQCRDDGDDKITVVVKWQVIVSHDGGHNNYGISEVAVLFLGEAAAVPVPYRVQKANKKQGSGYWHRVRVVVPVLRRLSTNSKEERGCSTQPIMTTMRMIFLEQEIPIIRTHRDEVALASVLSVFRRPFPKFKSSSILSAEWTWIRSKSNLWLIGGTLIVVDAASRTRMHNDKVK